MLIIIVVVRNMYKCIFYCFFFFIKNNRKKRFNGKIFSFVILLHFWRIVLYLSKILLLKNTGRYFSYAHLLFYFFFSFMKIFKFISLLSYVLVLMLFFLNLFWVKVWEKRNIVFTSKNIDSSHLKHDFIVCI